MAFSDGQRAAMMVPAQEGQEVTMVVVGKHFTFWLIVV